MICPDQRGDGDSTVPPNVEDYGIGHLTDDLLDLLDQFDHDQAVFVGHDWGALIVWGMAQLHPRRARAICAMKRPPLRPSRPARRAFRKGRRTGLLRASTSSARGLNKSSSTRGWYPTAMFRGLATPPEDLEQVTRDPGGTSRTRAVPLPAWLTEDDVNYYAEKFEKTGLFGGMSYYRNLDANWRLLKDIPYKSISMPVLFMTGRRDSVYTSPWNAVAGVEPGTSAVDAMTQVLPNFRGAVLIEGAGHWNQQEKADDTNRALLRFLSEVSPVD